MENLVVRDYKDLEPYLDFFSPISQSWVASYEITVTTCHPNVSNQKALPKPQWPTVTPTAKHQRSVQTARIDRQSLSQTKNVHPLKLISVQLLLYSDENIKMSPPPQATLFVVCKVLTSALPYIIHWEPTFCWLLVVHGFWNKLPGFHFSHNFTGVQQQQLRKQYSHFTKVC